MTEQITEPEIDYKFHLPPQHIKKDAIVGNEDSIRATKNVARHRRLWRRFGIDFGDSGKFIHKSQIHRRITSYLPHP